MVEEALTPLAVVLGIPKVLRLLVAAIPQVGAAGQVPLSGRQTRTHLIEGHP